MKYIIENQIEFLNKKTIILWLHLVFLNEFNTLARYC